MSNDVKYSASDTCDECGMGASMFVEDNEAELARLNMINADLLAALKALVFRCGAGAHDDDCPEDNTCDCSVRPLHDQINTAVAKAEGR